VAEESVKKQHRKKVDYQQKQDQRPLGMFGVDLVSNRRWWKVEFVDLSVGTKRATNKR